jgi:hypothetical protein
MVELTIVALLSEHTSTGLAILILLLVMSRRVAVVCRRLRRWRIHVTAIVVGHGCRICAAR